LLSKPFFSNKQISTGREEFGLKTAEEIIDFGKSLGLSSEDLMASVAELTILGILNGVKSLYENDVELDKLYLTGGGRKNTFFRERLSGYLPDIEIRLIDELGLDGDFVEAAAYAVLGEAGLRSESLENYRHKDKRDVLIPILGHIVHPPKVRN
jgi:anhydro-N-acetylmuramic acid kinase